MQLKIEIENPADVDILLAILERFKVKIIQESEKIEDTSQAKSQSSPLFWLDKLAEQGGVSSIQNPSDWQRETRIDSKLPFRD
ncbi:hypothetical protein [Bernardetia sp.]|uniref:hypothetical protein n=1 Tax=Bernardetia sp. TaxID=1937974 RepID=UPI0025BF1063|nr:hypothetical protein [Bernardetia sp.]